MEWLKWLEGHDHVKGSIAKGWVFLSVRVYCVISPTTNPPLPSQHPGATVLPSVCPLHSLHGQVAAWTYALHTGGSSQKDLMSQAEIKPN